jgi:hypothetical protein
MDGNVTDAIEKIIIFVNVCINSGTTVECGRCIL